MPRRSTLSATERAQLVALPETPAKLIRQYTFSEADLSLIHQHRGAANRLGFAVQLCYLRFPGIALGVEQEPFAPLLALVAAQLKLSATQLAAYGQREQTRREHLLELQAVLGFQTFTTAHYRESVQWLTDIGLQTDKGFVLVSTLIGHLRRQAVLLPALNVLERVSAEALTRANRQLYQTLTEALTPENPIGVGGPAHPPGGQPPDRAGVVAASTGGPHRPANAGAPSPPHRLASRRAAPGTGPPDSPEPAA